MELQQEHTSNGASKNVSNIAPEEGIVNAIKRINREQSAKYIADLPRLDAYMAKHPTRLVCLKCMDGRVHLSAMTGAPLGRVTPFRAIGGAFRPAWPAFMKRMTTLAQGARARLNRGELGRIAVLVSFHYSRSDKNLCCAGWKHDTQAAQAHARWLADELRVVYGDYIDFIVLGVETDLDELELHGPNGVVSGVACHNLSETEIFDRIRVAFPHLDLQTARDLAPLMAGNAKHVQEVASRTRSLCETHHAERVIALGQGFDWMATRNIALIVNDFDTNCDGAIVTACRIIMKNMGVTLASNADVVLFSNIKYKVDADGLDRRQAEARARDLRREAVQYIKQGIPEFLATGRVYYLVGVTNERTKECSFLEEGPLAA